MFHKANYWFLHIATLQHTLPLLFFCYNRINYVKQESVYFEEEHIDLALERAFKTSLMFRWCYKLHERQGNLIILTIQNSVTDKDSENLKEAVKYYRKRCNSFLRENNIQTKSFATREDILTEWNCCEWQVDSYFARNKLSQFGWNQILQVVEILLVWHFQEKIFLFT